MSIHVEESMDIIFVLTFAKYTEPLLKVWPGPKAIAAKDRFALAILLVVLFKQIKAILNAMPIDYPNSETVYPIR